MHRRSFLRQGLGLAWGAGMTLATLPRAWSPDVADRQDAIRLGGGGVRVSPPAVVPLPDAWGRASSLVGADGSRISSWADALGSGFAFDQATAGKRPAIDRGEINGKDAVRFDAARGDHLRWTGSALSGPRTVVLVVKPVDVAPSDTQYVFEGSSGQRQGIAYSTARSWLPVASTSGGVTKAQLGGEPVVLAAVFDGANSRMRMSGTDRTGDTGAITSPVALVLGADQFEARGFDGWIAEWLIWHEALTVPRLRRVEVSLGAYYGISLARSNIYWVDSAVGEATHSGTLPSSPYPGLAYVELDHTAAADATVYVKAPSATPLREELFWDKTANVAIRPWTEGEPWHIHGSISYESGWSAEGGGVYSRVIDGHSNTQALYAWAPTLLDADGNATLMRRDTNTPTSPPDGAWGYVPISLIFPFQGTAYVHLPGGINPNSHTIEITARSTCITARLSGPTITLHEVIGRYATLGCFRAGGVAEGDGGTIVGIDSEAWYGGQSGGWQTLGYYEAMTLTRCKGMAAVNDGFNIHGFTGVDGLVTLTNCEAGYNRDEGYSCHDDTVSVMTGGRLHHNDSGGATHVNNAIVTMTGVEMDRNQRNNPGSGVVGDSGGVNYLDTTSGTVAGCHVHHNPDEGIVVAATANVAVRDNTSGTAAGNGLPDNLSA